MFFGASPTSKFVLTTSKTPNPLLESIVGCFHLLTFSVYCLATHLGVPLLRKKCLKYLDEKVITERSAMRYLYMAQLFSGNMDDLEAVACKKLQAQFDSALDNSETVDLYNFLLHVKHFLSI